MEQLESGLPRLTLTNGMSIVFEAIDPSTGAQVPGVVVSNIAIRDEGGDGGGASSEQISVQYPPAEWLWSPTPAESV